MTAQMVLIFGRRTHRYAGGEGWRAGNASARRARSDRVIIRFSSFLSTESDQVPKPKRPRV